MNFNLNNYNIFKIYKLIKIVMAKVLDRVNDLIFIRLTVHEYEKINKSLSFDNEQDDFDNAVKSEEVKKGLALLASKL